jgi:cytochrome c
MRALFTALAILAAAPAAAQDDMVREGENLAVENCARCHAIGDGDASPHRDAPPFHTLSQLYPVEDLEEALAEGIVSGHPDMPEFMFEPEEVEALIAYLRSIQPS